MKIRTQEYDSSLLKNAKEPNLFLLLLTEVEEQDWTKNCEIKELYIVMVG